MGCPPWTDGFQSFICPPQQWLPHAMRLRGLGVKAWALAHEGSRGRLGSFLGTPLRRELRMPAWEQGEISQELWGSSHGRQEPGEPPAWAQAEDPRLLRPWANLAASYPGIRRRLLEDIKRRVCEFIPSLLRSDGWRRKQMQRW